MTDAEPLREKCRNAETNAKGCLLRNLARGMRVISEGKMTHLITGGEGNLVPPRMLALFANGVGPIHPHTHAGVCVCRGEKLGRN